MPPVIKRVYPVLSLSIFAATMGVGIIAPFLPLYAEDLGASGIWIGAIFAGFSLARTVSIPLGGRLSDSKGRKPLLIVGLAAAALMSAGYIFTGDVVSLTVVRFLHGMASGMVLPVAQAYVGDILPEGEEGKWMGFFNAMFFTGIGAGPLIGGFVAEHFGVNNAFLTMCGLYVLAMLGIAVFLPNISSRQKAAGKEPSSYREIAADRDMQGLFSFRLGFAMARGAMTTFLPILAGINLGLSTSLIGILLTVNTLGMSVLQIPSGLLADKVSKKALVLLGSGFYLAGTALIPSASSFGQLLVLNVLLGVGRALAVPAASVMVVNRGRRFGMGVVMAAFSLALTFGMFIGPLLAGVIADLSRTTSVFYFAAAAVFVTTVAFSWFVRSRPASQPGVDIARQE